ncbi:MAG: hypothetical protein V4473_01875 [Patescibacteria group bacterium]
MADEPKPSKPADKAPAPAAAPSRPDPFVEIVSFLIVIFLASFIVNGVIRSVTSSRLFSQGWSAFTPRGILLSHTRSISSLENPVGATVVVTSKGEIVVLDSAGGTSIGTQKMEVRGKVIQGPVTIGTQRYWNIDFDTGVDGWVNENDIAYLENTSGPTILERIILFAWTAGNYIKVISVILTVLAIYGIIHFTRKLGEMRRAEHAMLYPPPVVSSAGITNPKWDRVLQHIESNNENDWRLAILESDIMLSDILDNLGLPGETMGEKLKAVEKSDFQTIDAAWEAHKIRNQIAHEGADFVLSQREARRVIELYRAIFEEFHTI